MVHGEERMLEASPLQRRVQRAPGRMLDFDVLDPERRAVRRRHAVWTLVQDAQVEILEQRQDVGHRDGLAAAIEPQVERATGGVAGAQFHPERCRTGVQRSKLLQVVNGLGRRHVLLVRDGERVLEPGRQLVSRRGWQPCLQFVVQVVGPGSHRVRDALLDALDVGHDAARRVRAHEDVESCER